ncbi:RidA family protein [Nocardiopsis xinjiangensis]|uniref:RidA family protein n=1 Tax=Nocardiopsis xinjiangensis TaxID=124285 RepID=UPI00034946F0|nr:RidA family protein [Nocardiopsis xinjiangensis]
MTQSPHETVNPLTLAEPVGYSHALVVTPGRTVFVGGQTARRTDGSVAGDTVVQQFDQALGNVVEALRSAGAEPVHVVDMRIHTTSLSTYRANLGTLGSIYRRHMGRHYPAMSALGVHELLERGALVEITCTAVVPDSHDNDPLSGERAMEIEVEEGLVSGPFADPAEPGNERARTST